MVLMETEIQHLHEGISGWLSLRGEFIPVDYGNHAQKALDLEVCGVVKSIAESDSGQLVHGERLLELLGFIKFVCRFAHGNTIESHVFFPQQFGCWRNITDSQKEWLERNWEKMTPNQEFYAMQYLY